MGLHVEHFVGNSAHVLQAGLHLVQALPSQVLQVICLLREINLLEIRMVRYMGMLVVEELPAGLELLLRTELHLVRAQLPQVR